MAVTARFLIDTSAAARMRHDAVFERLVPLIEAGVIGTCATLDAEALDSARGPAEYEQIRSDRRDAYEYLATGEEHWQAAFDAQRALARTGRHRAVGFADLLTASVAADHRVAVIHHDADFDTASEVLPFESIWVAPRGSMPWALLDRL